MPIEYTLLKGKPWPATKCSNNGKCDCWQTEEPFMRGQVQSWWRRMLGLPYCAVICPILHNIVGWEKPEKKKRPF